MDELVKAAAEVRKMAYAPYSNFQVGAAVRTTDGRIFVGCNVENVAYPEGTCAEAGAIAAMIAAGAREISAVAVISGASEPVTPCGGCRQKLAEFGAAGVPVVMATTQGAQFQSTIGDLLPANFSDDHMES